MIYLSVQLLPIHQLKPHEKTIPERVEKIKSEILRMREIKTPIWIDKRNFVVLNGHHRLQALSELGCMYVPCFLLDYDSEDIEVTLCPGSSMIHMNKEIVLDSALSGNLLPARSSFHILKMEPPPCPIPLAILFDSIPMSPVLG